MGISNWSYDTKTKKKYSVQFYDYDFSTPEKKIPRSDLLEILKIFPYDCLMYETKQGVHFISFALLHGLGITKKRTLETSKALGQDYWTEAKDLTLRCSAKWKPRRFRNYKTISNKPKFKGLVKFPNKYTISKKHLEFYFKYMGLPLWVYNLYSDCIKKDYRIKNYHYKTRD